MPSGPEQARPCLSDAWPLLPQRINTAIVYERVAIRGLRLLQSRSIHSTQSRNALSPLGNHALHPRASRVHLERLPFRALPVLTG